MLFGNKLSNLLLLIGDIFVFALSLYVALTVRYLEVPSQELLLEHFIPFSFLFLLGVAIFFIAGLYDKKVLLFPKQLPRRIFWTQITNSVVAAVFFYTFPVFFITPKTNLFIYLLVSLALVLLWRNLGARILEVRRRNKTILLASGTEANKLRKELNKSHYGLKITEHIDPNQLSGEDLFQRVAELSEKQDVSFVVLDTRQQVVQSVLPKLYNLLYTNIHFYNFDAVYEEVFERVPLSLLDHGWFISNINFSPHAAYDSLKRTMDIISAIVLGLLSLIFYPFVILAIWLEDGRPIFYKQTRVGQGRKPISLIKFRTMRESSGEESENNEDRITAVGRFFRKTRIDELPQLYNVLRGDLSLIGPRPEIPEFVSRYESTIPYYSARHLIKPGLSGWAQLKERQPARFELATDKTKNKLSYDLYYVKHRSLLLDIKIALWTLRVLASRTGR